MLSLASNISCNQALCSNLSVDLDGVDDKINCGPSNDVIANGASEASAMYWIKTTDTDNNYVFSIKRSATSSAFSSAIQGNKIRGVIFDGSSFNFPTSTTDINDGSWHHVAITGKASSQKIYVDGSLEATTTGSFSMATSSDPFLIGDHNNSHFIDGAIRELAVFNTELDLANVQAAYSNGSPIDLTIDQGNYSSSSNLTAYYKMGNGLHDDILNGAIHDQDNPGFGSNLVTWDGSTTSDWSVASLQTTLSANSGRLRATATQSSGNYGVSQSFTTVVNEVYRVDYNINVDNGSGGAGDFKVATNSGLFTDDEILSSSTEIGVSYFTATATTTHIGLLDIANDSSNYLELESISVKKINGNPGLTSGGPRFIDDSP